MSCLAPILPKPGPAQPLPLTPIADAQYLHTPTNVLKIEFHFSQVPGTQPDVPHDDGEKTSASKKRKIPTPAASSDDRKTRSETRNDSGSPPTTSEMISAGGRTASSEKTFEASRDGPNGSTTGVVERATEFESKRGDVKMYTMSKHPNNSAHNIIVETVEMAVEKSDECTVDNTGEESQDTAGESSGSDEDSQVSANVAEDPDDDGVLII